MTARAARVKVRPQREPAPDAAWLQRGFSGHATDVSDLVVEGGVVRARVRVDCRGAPQAELLERHKDDDRLWNAWIASLFVGGVCDVESSVVVVD